MVQSVKKKVFKKLLTVFVNFTFSFTPTTEGTKSMSSQPTASGLWWPQDILG